MKENKYNIGDRVKCFMTGYEGTIMGICKVFDGDLHYAIAKDVDKEGNLSDWKELSEKRLELVKESERKFDIPTAKFNPLDKVRDTITGFTGKVVDITFYFSGCIYYGVAPMKLTKDGSIGKSQFLSQKRLEIVKAAKEKKKEKDGGPDSSAPKRY